MKKFIDTLKNIWKIEDLRQRILITVLFVAIYRFGSKIVLPGIAFNKLGELHAQTENGLMALLDMFSGGAFSNASIFALGIMPYISASIVMQLLAVAVPCFPGSQLPHQSAYAGGSGFHADHWLDLVHGNFDRYPRRRQYVHPLAG